MLGKEVQKYLHINLEYKYQIILIMHQILIRSTMIKDGWMCKGMKYIQYINMEGVLWKRSR